METTRLDAIAIHSAGLALGVGLLARLVAKLNDSGYPNRAHTLPESPIAYVFQCSLNQRGEARSV